MYKGFDHTDTPAFKLYCSWHLIQITSVVILPLFEILTNLGSVLVLLVRKRIELIASTNIQHKLCCQYISAVVNKKVAYSAMRSEGAIL